MHDKVEIRLFSETKLEETFPKQQFRIHGYKMYRGIETNMAVEFFVMSIKIFLPKW